MKDRESEDMIYRSVGIHSFGGDPFLFVLLLEVEELDVVGEGNAGALGVLGVVFLHDFDLDSHHSLLQHDVSHSDVKIVLLGISGRNHVTLFEFHGLGSLLGKLSRNDDLASLSLLLIDSLTDDRRNGNTDGDLSQEFELDGLGHSTGAETLLFESHDLDVDAVGLVSPSLLDKGLEFPDLALVVVKERLGVGDLEDDFGFGEGVGEVEAGVAAFLKGLVKERVQFGLEKSVEDVLLESQLGLVGGHKLINIKKSKYSIHLHSLLIKEFQSPSCLDPPKTAAIEMGPRTHTADNFTLYSI